MLVLRSPTPDGQCTQTKPFWLRTMHTVLNILLNNLWRGTASAWIDAPLIACYHGAAEMGT
jgi:hypothetical protein